MKCLKGGVSFPALTEAVSTAEPLPGARNMLALREELVNMIHCCDLAFGHGPLLVQCVRSELA